MIVVRLMGGLGNQMFQYAFGKYLSVKNNTELKLDLTILGYRNHQNPLAIFRDFELNIFDSTHTIATAEEIDRYNRVGKRNLFKSMIHSVKNKFRGSKNVFQEGHNYDHKYLQITDDHCIIGRWQSERFFYEIKDVIKKEFQFKKVLNESNDYFKRIRSGNSVAVHVRRGDYVTNIGYAERIGALNLDYYLRSAAYLKGKVKDLQFFVFSDDIAWCKEQFKSSDFIFVEQKGEFNKPEFDLQLITKCDYHIISNSTFSWWGAWLSEKANSIIIAPKTWAKSKEYTPDYIVPDRWVLMDNGFEPIIDQK